MRFTLSAWLTYPPKWQIKTFKKFKERWWPKCNNWSDLANRRTQSPEQAPPKWPQIQLLPGFSENLNFYVGRKRDSLWFHIWHNAVLHPVSRGWYSTTLNRQYATICYFWSMWHRQLHRQKPRVGMLANVLSVPTVHWGFEGFLHALSVVWLLVFNKNSLLLL